MSDVARMPYAVATRTMIKKLVQIGYLHPDKQHRAEAVEEAMRHLRERSEQFFREIHAANEQPPTA